MDIYDTVMAPLETSGLSIIRSGLAGRAVGDVLELGAGNGANFNFYKLSALNSLTITDVKLSKKLVRLKNINTANNVKFLEADVCRLPFADKSFDTVVFTLMFCSVPDVAVGLSEVMRVLKDDGIILFLEHVILKTNPANTVMNAINPVWKCIAHGCNINRDFERSLQESGFTLCASASSYKGIGFSGIAKKGSVNSCKGLSGSF